MQTVAITEASTADLLTFFNTHVVRLQDGAPIKRFSDRQAAEKRVHKLVEALASYFGDKEGSMVPPEGMIFIGELEDEEGNKVEVQANESTSHVGNLKKEDGSDEDEDEEEEGPNVNTFGSMSSALEERNDKKRGQPDDSHIVSKFRGASNSAGVARSWLDSRVRSERLTRDGVVVFVDEKQVGVYRSVHAAFTALRLPIQFHIRFRVKLKAEGSRDIEHDGVKYTFKIVPISLLGEVGGSEE